MEKPIEHPLVTVLTLLYNTPYHIAIESINSVRKNSYPKIQHIIIDDCTSDRNTIELIKLWILKHEYKCEVIEHERNVGIVKSANQGIELAKGRYLFYCCDDIFLADRISEDVQVFEALGDDYAVVYSIAQYIDDSGNKLVNTFPNLNFARSTEPLEELLFHANPICAPAATTRLDYIRDLGGYDEQFWFEDYPMWFMMVKKGYKFKFVPEIRTLYRYHSNSVTTNKRFDTMLECVRIQLHFAENINHYKIIREGIITTFLNNDDAVTMDMVNLYLQYRPGDKSVLLIKRLHKTGMSHRYSANIFKILSKIGLA